MHFCKRNKNVAEQIFMLIKTTCQTKALHCKKSEGPMQGTCRQTKKYENCLLNINVFTLWRILERILERISRKETSYLKRKISRKETSYHKRQTCVESWRRADLIIPYCGKNNRVIKKHVLLIVHNTASKKEWLLKVYVYRRCIRIDIFTPIVPQFDYTGIVLLLFPNWFFFSEFSDHDVTISFG